MLDKVNVTKIVRDHLQTFKDNSTRKYRPLDFLLFFLVPLLVAAGFAGILGALPTNLIGVIATSLSIYCPPPQSASIGLQHSTEL